MASTAQGEGRHAAAVRRYRQAGYRAGYAGREPSPPTGKRLLDAYRKAYRAGERAWQDDQEAELQAWEAAQAARS